MKKWVFPRIKNSINSTNLPLLTSSQISLLSAVRSIILSYTTDNNALSPTAPAKKNSHLRIQRKYGEVITDSNLLEELKQKEVKRKREIKKKVP